MTMLEQAILGAEPAIRLAAFLGGFAVLGVAEAVQPRRRRSFGRMLRWTNNLALVTVNALVLRLLFPAAVVGAALFAGERGWGLLSLVGLPMWLAIPVAIVVLDLAIYAQHRAFHAVPMLWRVHRMHHADRDVDVTTGLRFHPLEMVLSLLWKQLVVIALGAPATAVLIFEVLLNLLAMFTHANLRLTPAFDRALRRFVVTPDMHRVHHSTSADEHQSNFGFNLSCWDRWFRTYRAEPRLGDAAMTIGLESFRSPRDLLLDRLLLLPFRSDKTAPEGTVDAQ